MAFLGDLLPDGAPGKVVSLLNDLRATPGLFRALGDALQRVRRRDHPFGTLCNLIG